jgi:alpha-mannosidase
MSSTLVRSVLSVAILLVATSATWGVAKPENLAQQNARTEQPARDPGDPGKKSLYCVGYAHLDTQWRWDFVKTIDDYIMATLDDNFALFEKYPEYVFNFTGSVRYQMMKEYYPKRYEQLKTFIAAGRWRVSGSSVDEGDVNVPSPESIIRQVLYGNLFFKREFGKESYDFMLPDCFGFPASMPTLWAHCGLLGFSTQKLTWGSAVGIPFPIGVWEGPDGNGVIAALDPGAYVGAIDGRVDQNQEWLDRVQTNGEKYGLWADYHYYGVGDMGGAPREKDVKNYIASQNAADAKMDILLAASDQLYKDISPELRAKLPTYKGDMLLTEHSAGTLTSQSYMKRWNRKGEQLADAAERAAAMAWHLGLAEYPRHKLENAWVRLLANQMHDILPGTSIPRAYRYSWNDNVIALNQFADVLTDSIARISTQMNTAFQGIPLIVYNPLDIERTELVEATVPNIRPVVLDPDGTEIQHQLIEQKGRNATILFPARVPPNSLTVYEVRHANSTINSESGPNITDRSVENEYYRISLNDAGDIAQILDKKTNRELLSKPATLEFTYERPRNYPAWNMDWADRKNPPVGKVDGPAQFRIIERGPLRAALAVTRSARNSTFTQNIRLTRGSPIVEIDAEIDWQSTECALKAAFPLTVANPMATYNWGCGTIKRGNNDPTKYEVPSHEWFDLAEPDGSYGITVLEDSKFGSDKPADNELRLTLLYSPGVRSSFKDQHSQDWGVHRIRYGLYAHQGDHNAAGSEWHGRRFNQPLHCFMVNKYQGPLGRQFSFAKTNSNQVDIRAIKLAEDRDMMIIRTQELRGESADHVTIEFPAPIIHAIEIDGQEREIGSIEAIDNAITFNTTPFGLRSFAVKLDQPAARQLNRGTSIDLDFDTDVATMDGDPTDGSMDSAGRSYPAEQLPAELTNNGVEFKLGSSADGQMNAMTCRGQSIDIGAAEGHRIHILAAATEDVETQFHIGDTRRSQSIQSWTGFVGQWYDRVWDQECKEVDFECDGKVTAILPAFIKRAPIAWFATHRHHPERGNEAYKFSYIYHFSMPPYKASTLKIPYDERIRIFAITVADAPIAMPAAPLYDVFENEKPIEIRHKYDDIADPVYAGQTSIADVFADKAKSFDELAIGPPRKDDDVDGSSYEFRTFAPDSRWEVHTGSGAVEGVLTRLNDGEFAQNNDDTKRCVWYDNEGRFTIDLHQSKSIASINTYSWHKSDRAPQYFSVWGSNSGSMPDAGFKPNDDTDWQLIAVVDTRDCGDGWIHGTRIEVDDGELGPYRHLLFITEDIGHGTFFTEIDIDFAR